MGSRCLLIVVNCNSWVQWVVWWRMEIDFLLCAR